MAFHTERELFFQGISLANIAALSLTAQESFSQVGLWSINVGFNPNRTIKVDGATTGTLAANLATLVMDLMKNR